MYHGKDNGLRQEDYIYGLEWDATVVSLFIEVLADQARMGKFNNNGNNKHAIQTAQYVVNKFFSKNFDVKDCVKQIRLLRQRHSTFSTMMLRDDLGWSLETGSIDCMPETWEDIVKNDPFAWAYAHVGDPHWEDLQVIFGSPTPQNMSHPRPVTDQEVIVISDNTSQRNVAHTYTPLDQVINISSDKSGSLSTGFWNELGPIGNSSDEEGSIRSPSIKTEMSSSNPHINPRDRSKKSQDGMLKSFYGKSYVSSSNHASPKGKN